MQIIRRGRARDHTRGQALVEFALTLPILVAVVLGIVQFGLLFWTQITLTQVARDTGRWVASQQTCNASINVAAQANQVAGNSLLFAWSAGNQVSLATGPTWTDATPGGAGDPCPPEDNRQVFNVTFTLRHTVPVFLPMVADTCTPDCLRSLESAVQYRMEPVP